LPPTDPRDGYGGLLAGAELLLTLDLDGDIARIAVRSAHDDPDLVLELDIMRLGEPQAIAPPDGGDAGLRRTVPVDKLEAVGGYAQSSSDASRRDGSSPARGRSRHRRVPPSACVSICRTAIPTPCPTVS
jgi:hypothetical protein